MVSRREVAEAAGVSVRTVSNVANNFEYVAPATRARVLEVIERLSYRPSELARSLKVGRSGLVGLMVPELDTPYFAELTRAVVEEGHRQGLIVVIDQTSGDPERERGFVHRAARGSLFDALILSPLAMAPEELAALAQGGPVVFLGEDPSPGFDKVMIDNFAAAEEAVSHLIGIGRRRIAAIGAENTAHGSSALRLGGYLSALTAAGMVHDDSLVHYVGAFGRTEGAAAMHRLLDLPERPDAVFCFSDPLALGALRACYERGVRVPSDLAVVGFDDVEDARFAIPTLSSISPDKGWIARTALDRVIRRLAGEELESETLIGPHGLAVRESSAVD